MQRTLLITNDFPPRVGGIQSYVYELARRLPADRLVVMTSSYPGAADFDRQQAFPVVRRPTQMLLPTPGATRAAIGLIKSHRIGAVWFGAAAPLGLMAPALRRAGIGRIVASTHGHEVGWSMLPGARQMLRRVGRSADVVTYVSRYSRGRIAAALGPMAALESLSPGVDTNRFRPDPGARARLRARYQLGAAPAVVCISRLVPRKGQDMLIAAWPAVCDAVPGAKLVIVGGGRDERRIQRLANASAARSDIVLTGPVPYDELPDYYPIGDVFAMPCRARGGGLDVEGLGIVFLEASACGLPVVVGDSGGAPETVRPGITGRVVSGSDVTALANALARLLGDPARAGEWGAAGRRWVQQNWTWRASADRLAALLG